MTAGIVGEEERLAFGGGGGGGGCCVVVDLLLAVHRCKDQTPYNVLPVLVPPGQRIFHRSKMGSHERKLHDSSFRHGISQPHTHGALVAHLLQADTHSTRLHPLNFALLLFLDEDHAGRHAYISRNDVGVPRRLLPPKGFMPGQTDGMAESVKVRQQVRPAEERVCERGEFLQTEDYDVWAW
ncbi:MAG: hypothetical protein L6R35_003895 [Caloplaca aegaea]|nr:MAG: hypothetical protein L6R35_003895 [Caloplaca aegaea]